MKRKKIGDVGVDSGQVMITDPCYIENEWIKRKFDPHSPRTREFSYNGACHETVTEGGGGQLNYRLGHAGAGVAASSGWGDGVYPIFASYNEEGRIAKLEIIFIDDEEETE